MLWKQFSGVSKGWHMTSHDKAVNLENNVNTRDQRNAGIWLIVLVILFIAFLYALGLGHAPSSQSAAGQQVEPLSPNSPPSQSSDDSAFSVNQPVGSVELPGTVGKPQHFLTGHGNTPVPAQGVSPAVPDKNAEYYQSAPSGQSTGAASTTSGGASH